MRQTSFIFAFLFCVLAVADAQDPVKAVGAWKQAKGDKITLSVGLEVEEPGFRVYKDSIKVAVTGRTVLENAMPAGEKKFDPLSKKEKEIFTGRTEWPLVFSKKSEEKLPIDVEVAITYRACNDKICHFPKTKKLQLSPKKPVSRADIGGAISEFWTLLNSVDGERIKQLATQHMWLALLLCFASGILTSLTPCVYPMIPITINIFGRAAQKRGAVTGESRSFNWHTFGLAGIYVAGMCATYSLMGVIAGVTGSLFGKILQSSFMLGFLTVLFFALALGQFGLFKMALPASWQNRLAQVGSADNPGGIFLMGLFSGLIVSPCVGPVIAGILAFVFDSSNAFVGFIYFLSFSLGLGVLFLLIGGFSGVLGKLPRSGPWMMRVNRILACLMLFAAGYYGLVWAKQVGIIQRAESQAITWVKSESAALKLASENNKPLLVDFTAEWCGACHEIDATIFSDPKVIARMADFIPLRLDVTAESDENLAILKKYGVMSLPAIVFADRSGKILEKPRVNGVVPVDTFLAAMNGL